MEVTVIVPTHNPVAKSLGATLAGLGAQQLARDSWETIVVDNASSFPVTAMIDAIAASLHVRVVSEPRLGLTAARVSGLREAKGGLVVFVDDDNVLAPDYLQHVVRLFGDNPQLGACGGRSVPHFEVEPPDWAEEFFPLLALRDLGDRPLVAGDQWHDRARGVEYPAAAPIGAGMAVRREAVECWLAVADTASLPDRRGQELTSGGDNDIVLTLAKHGWHVGYFPELSLTHLIPAHRLTVDYLARLNRGIQFSWMRVLTRHGANPWPLVSPWSVHWRELKAWLTYRAWSSPAARVRWQGACGHFEGRCRNSSP